MYNLYIARKLRCKFVVFSGPRDRLGERRAVIESFSGPYQ